MTRCQPLGDLCQLLQAEGRAKELQTPRERLEDGVSEGCKEGMLGVCTTRERTGGRLAIISNTP